jgi:hypothetical protein
MPHAMANTKYFDRPRIWADVGGTSALSLTTP